VNPLLDLAWAMNGWKTPARTARRNLRRHRHAEPGRDTAALRLGQRAGLDEIDYYVILAGFELAIAYGQVVLDTMAAAAELASTTPLGSWQRQRGRAHRRPERRVSSAVLLPVTLKNRTYAIENAAADREGPCKNSNM
jgi:hypothetical protein